jgi:hypothetical protein
VAKFILAHAYSRYDRAVSGTTVQILRNVCRDDIDATTLIDQAVQKPGGRPSKTVSNRHSLDRPAGTTRDRALRRLRDHRPDLHERVVMKELSAHRAMIEAGFRRRTFTVPDDIDAGEAEAAFRRPNCPPLLP